MSEEEVKTEDKSPDDLITEALEQLNIEDVEDTGEPQDEPQMSEVEAQAYEMGWRPKTEHKGDQPWIGAEEFIGRKPLYDGLSKANKRVKSLEDKIQKLLDHNSKIEQAQYEKAMRELTREHRQAVREGRDDDADAIEEKQRQLEADQKPQEDNFPPEFLAWRDENEWYTTDPELQQFADSIAPGMKQSHPNLGPKEFFELVGNTVQKAFPDKFDPPKPKPRRIPEGGDAPQKGSGQNASQAQKLWGKMTPEEQMICRQWDRDGTMKKADYMKQLDLQNR